MNYIPHLRKQALPLFAFALPLIIVAATFAADTDRPGWLSAADFGASGSTFETAAATTAGRRKSPWPIRATSGRARA